MRKIFFLFVLVSLLTIVCISCNSMDINRGTYIEKKAAKVENRWSSYISEPNVCELMSLDESNDEYRSWGESYKMLDPDSAKQSAINHAKCFIVQRVCGVYDTTLLELRNAYNGDSSIWYNREASVKSFLALSNSEKEKYFSTYANLMPDDFSIPCSQLDKYPDGGYISNVCISVKEDLIPIIKKNFRFEELSKRYSGRKSSLNFSQSESNDTIGLNFNEIEFRKSYEEELERFRQQQQNKSN